MNHVKNSLKLRQQTLSAIAVATAIASQSMANLVISGNTEKPAAFNLKKEEMVAYAFIFQGKLILLSEEIVEAYKKMTLVDGYDYIEPSISTESVQEIGLSGLISPKLLGQFVTEFKHENGTFSVHEAVEALNVQVEDVAKVMSGILSSLTSAGDAKQLKQTTQPLAQLEAMWLGFQVQFNAIQTMVNHLDLNSAKIAAGYKSSTEKTAA